MMHCIYTKIKVQIDKTVCFYVKHQVLSLAKRYTHIFNSNMINSTYCVFQSQAEFVETDVQSK